MTEFLKPPFLVRHGDLIVTLALLIVLNTAINPHEGTVWLIIAAPVMVISVGISEILWKTNRQRQMLHLRTQHFRLIEVRNPAEEAAAICGTRFPTQEQMLEVYCRSYDLDPEEVPVKWPDWVQTYDDHFPDRFEISFFRDSNGEKLTWTVQRGHLHHREPYKAWPSVRFPRLFIFSEGTIMFGDHADIYD